ncbi:MAG TPA: M28 family peptidase [Bryobacteraceae bacterium]|nr:M28 family peptidase [Bryobacteraceae bacterium]
MLRLCLLSCFGIALVAAQLPESIRQWWTYAQALSNNSMEGRDTGSEGYRNAGAYVVSKFEKAGLRPAGTSGYYQAVPLHEVRLLSQESSARLLRKTDTESLKWLHDITITAASNVPASIKGELVFLGSDPQTTDINGKVVVQLRAAAGGARRATEKLEGAVAVLAIDSTAGPEPPRWPAAYSVSMRLEDDPLPKAAKPLIFRINPAAAEKLFAGSGHSYQELKELAEAGKPLPSFEIPAVFDSTMHFKTKNLSSDNIVASLPGSDPELSKQYIVVSAHLDGYGFGEPWNGDRIYNGTFDDAAYVATLIDLADNLRGSHTHLKRSVLFCVFTGEEKGLLGSKYFTSHLTVPREQLAADINLDQLRPIFPLKIMTALAINDSSLGESARQVAEDMGIRLQADPEPQRNLLRRSDHYNFMQIGVPAIGFIFGYEKNSPEEAVYRRWYAERYHSPADDLNQPWDPAAAAKFNDFFDRLVIRLANNPDRPFWNPTSSFAHRTSN